MYTAITKQQIEKNISWCDDILNISPGCLKFWQCIKIEPEKWEEEKMGKEGSGFWVIAIIGKKVIYYNDIEEGFNFSKFTAYGKIDEYECGQSELHELVEALYQGFLTKGLIL